MVQLCPALVLALLAAGAAAEPYTCDRLHEVPPGKRCQFVTEQCDSEGGLPYTRWYYCSVEPHGVAASCFFTVLLACLLPLLFTLLGDTAEMYFSPIMTHVSQSIPKMRPRFAGVTFVAIGNGATDLSANITAIRNGDVLLSAGALTGAAMFVQCVVASEVMRASRGPVKCGGATLRDLGIYIASVVLVLTSFAYGKVRMGEDNLLVYRWCRTAVLVVRGVGFLGDEWLRGDVRGRPWCGGVSASSVSSRRGADEDASTDYGTESYSDNDDDAEEGLLESQRRRRRRHAAFEEGECPVEEDGGGGLTAAVAGPSSSGLRSVLVLESTGRPNSRAGERRRGCWSKLQYELTVGNSAEWEELPVDSLRRRWRTVTFPVLLPFYAALRFSIPFVDPATYSRRWLIATCLGGPLLVAFYMAPAAWRLQLLAAVLALTVGAVLAAAVAYFTAGEEDALPDWDLGTSFAFGPAFFAVFGFFMGIIWIDLLASEVVGVISLLASLLRLPASVMGLTLLAWGNSLGDFFGNPAMARRGKPTMALTACFAGPLFNMLTSLALGFGSYLAQSSQTHVRVVLRPEVALGCGFLVMYNLAVAAAGLMNHGSLPERFYLFARGWYLAYLATACVVGLWTG
ncbi:hypothetical protein VOLCADRAFT_93618 [Volvox carteri f. nagariensis]|uniref:Sodium/calcium exchanger membrane region domain-containing protein n=1 Tax=Volvox carteri f. nagariensis TaxID=3068 RepID=D8U2L0_VOLCA|nr:uncharacterized protein VOLCADRAFT_93618 [Volvox carteri f. nagariensis]EFJ46155.1 hypothetical protein VOLCADRAFT_93618 [Volvox carteri f. nagariensis]|eukprot:XP_002952905.1 hypothetical protein VOLCADRAFT_93618 [Volvox carteri f. nagariensis]